MRKSLSMLYMSFSLVEMIFKNTLSFGDLFQRASDASSNNPFPLEDFLIFHLFLSVPQHPFIALFLSCSLNNQSSHRIITSESFGGIILLNSLRSVTALKFIG